MARSSDSEKREIWGTREELLLAFAVTRHGIRRWDSVAMEIQSRTTASHLVTPQSCRQRFRDLQRRFNPGAVNGSGDDDDGGGDADSDPPPYIPWQDDLRRLRVTELRREVDHYDLSIRSLQLKVKRLQEEIRSRETNSCDEKQEKEAEKEGCSPESLAGDRISSGDGAGPSVEHSNSTDQKHKPCESGQSLGEEAALPSNGGDEKTAEASYNGSTGSPAAGGAVRLQAMGESGESIAESKGGEAGEGDKETSDVQSSASLSRRRRKPVIACASGGEEPEVEEVSKGAAAESHPLVAILETIRSDTYGSVFERRLESQEGAYYRSLVRQHVDLDMVRAKLDNVAYGRPYATAEFFRDLLLLCTNAAVFYNKDSSEFVAAVHLRRLVAKEMATTLRTPEEPTASAPPSVPSQPKPTVPKPKPEPDLTGALADKSIPSAPLIVCRKRSSIANKSAAAAVNEERDEKPELARKELDDVEREKDLPKKATKERSVLSGTTRGLRTSKVRIPAAKRLSCAPPLKVKSAENVADAGEAGKPDKKNSSGGASASTGSAAKKQSATGFLNRMKRSTNGTLMEMLKSSSSTGGGSGKGVEQKKEAKGEGRKEQSSRQRSASGVEPGKKAAETSGGSAKRSVGRPPKRGAATPTVPGKRTREVAETAAPSKTPASTSRKRGRR